MIIITDHSKAHHFCAAPFISSLEIDVNYRQINLKLFNTLEGQNLLIKDLSLTQRRRQIEKMGRRHPLNTWATKIIAIRSTGNNIHVLSASFQFDCCIHGMRIEDCLISLTVCADHDSSHTHHHNVYSLLKSFLELKRQENKNPQKPQKIGDIWLKGVKTCFMHRTLAHLLLSKSSKSFPPSEPSSQLFSC